MDAAEHAVGCRHGPCRAQAGSGSQADPLATRCAVAAAVSARVGDEASDPTCAAAVAGEVPARTGAAAATLSAAGSEAGAPRRAAAVVKEPTALNGAAAAASAELRQVWTWRPMEPRPHLMRGKSSNS